jgi:hypothetical protein
VFIEGMLADGTPLFHRTRIDGRGSIPLYIPLNKAGFLAGRIDFADVPYVSHFSGALTWRRPPSTKGLFKEGFETITMALGSKNSAFPPDAFPPVNWDDFTDPNAMIVLSGGNWSSEVRNGVRIEFYSADLSSFNLSAPFDKLFQVGGSFPSFAGTFTDPVTNKKRKFVGVFFRKQNRTFGIFKGDTEMGTVELEPEVE